MSETPAAPHSIRCGNCHTDLAADLVAQLKDPYRLGLTLTPHEGTRLEARVVGEAIINLATLMRTVARDMGGNVLTTVEKLAMDEAGVVTVELLVVSSPKKARKAKKPTP